MVHMHEDEVFELLLGPNQPPENRNRIVLVHGWLGDHRAWIKTGKWLHEAFNHSVLLLDLHGWGRSTNHSNRPLCAPEYATQLRKTIEKFQWHSHKIILAGKSLGGAVSIHYALRHSDHISRLLLFCPAGGPEPNPLMLPNLGQFVSNTLLANWIRPQILRRIIVRLFVYLFWRFWIVRYAYTHLSLLTTTPEYQVPRGFAHHLANATQVIAFQGNQDWLHIQPALDFASTPAKVTFYKHMGHMDLCHACADWPESELPDHVWH
eukprot:c9691_g1_i3.p1 GENE.c9691_g1_i3~~c9691_g1_i3.p1  ORF type:complete len:264 (+),score=37.89 c9691_g1_i3:40-831(+)